MNETSTHAAASDLGALLPPARRGFAQALHEVRALFARDARAVELYGAAGSLGAAVAAALAAGAGGAGQAGEASRGPLLYVVADEETAEARASDLAFFLPPAAASDDPLAPPPVLELPAPDSSPYADMQPDRRTTLRRMAALFRLSQGFAPAVLVASAAALFRKVVPRAPFDALCDMISSGSTLNRDATIAALVRAGFSRAAVVEDAGTFAVRGAVIDLFPPVYRHPVRIELFGDEVESIRLYDAATQRTLRPLDAVYVHPVRETIATPGADTRAKILAAADAAVYPSSKTRRLLEQIDEGELFFGIEALAPAFHAAMAPLFDYLPAGALCVVEDPEAVIDEARRSETRLREAASTRHVEHRLALPATDFVLSEDEAAATLAAHRRRGCTWSPRRTRHCAPSCSGRGPTPRARRPSPRASTSAGRCASACARGWTRAIACASSPTTARTRTGWWRCSARSAWRPTSCRRPATRWRARAAGRRWAC